VATTAARIDRAREVMEQARELSGPRHASSGRPPAGSCTRVLEDWDGQTGRARQKLDAAIEGRVSLLRMQCRQYRGGTGRTEEFARGYMFADDCF